MAAKDIKSTDTTEFTRNDQPVERTTAGPAHAAEMTERTLADVTRAAPAQGATEPGNEERVTVKAIRSFRGEEGFKTPDSEPFETRKSRAAELRANGLIEYQNESDENAAIEEQVKAQGDRTRKSLEAGRMKPENKSTPLEQKMPDFKK